MSSQRQFPYLAQGLRRDPNIVAKATSGCLTDEPVAEIVQCGEPNFGEAAAGFVGLTAIPKSGMSGRQTSKLFRFISSHVVENEASPMKKA